MTKNMLSSLLFLFLFYGLCIYAICCDGGKERVKEVYQQSSTIQKLILVLAVLFFVMFVRYWVQQDRYVYFWDHSAYWTWAINRMHYMFNNSFSDIVKTLHHSINYDDYNLFLPTVTAFPISIFGYTFSKYVTICCIMFLAPSFFVQGLIISKMIKNDAIPPNKVLLISVILSVCFSGNYYAVFRGYIDVAFLLPMSAAMYLFVDYDFRRISLSRNLAIALMLVMTWVSRRYTIFFLIGYVVAMTVKALAIVISDKRIHSLKNIVINFLQIGLVSLGILLILFPHFFFHALLTNYGEMYSAYDTPLAEKINSLTASFGYISAVLILVVGVMCFITKTQVVNYISLFLMTVTEIIVFWQTQNMGVHHRMILNLPIYVLCMMIFEQWQGKHRDKKLYSKIKELGKNTVVFLCVLSMLINFLKPFSNDLSVKGCGKYFSERYYPLQRGDIDSLNLLCAKLNKLTEETEDGIYIAASGTILNCDILRKLHMPDSDNAIPNMFNTCDIDLRDGFPTEFLHAKYVVTTDPIQTHLATGQEVVTYLASNIMDSDSYMGYHFECIDQVELDYGVVAKIYYKTSEFTEDDLQQMRDYYTNLYPAYEAIFAERIRH